MQIKKKIKYTNTNETVLIPIKTINIKNQKNSRKPPWIKIKLPTNSSSIENIKSIIRKNDLHTVCEEASCPNLFDCFSRNTATFMILGNICTRHCPFCNVTHGRPIIPDNNEPRKLAQTITELGLNYVVLTSVNRDDLVDGGAQHFVNCIREIRNRNLNILVEILVPDFRGCMNHALSIINTAPPNVFNHNLENVPRLYKKVRPGANYLRSLKLLESFKIANPHLATKSGLMVGLGETKSEIIKVIHDLYSHGVTMLTLGQYLQPSYRHLPVKRYFSLQEFKEIKQEALSIGFTHVACGPFVRSSYHADLQAKGIEVK